MTDTVQISLLFRDSYKSIHEYFVLISDRRDDDYCLQLPKLGPTGWNGLILPTCLQSTMGKGSFVPLGAELVLYDSVVFEYLTFAAGTDIGELKIRLSYHVSVFTCLIFCFRWQHQVNFNGGARCSRTELD